MKTRAWIGLPLILLCSLSSLAAYGQTTFGPPSGFGPSCDRLGSLCFTSPLTARHPSGYFDTQTLFVPRQTVAERNREIQSIRPGMTRLQLAYYFARAGGFYAVIPGEGVYSYRKCPEIKIRVWFDNPDTTSEQSADKIVRISPPYRTPVAYD